MQIEALVSGDFPSLRLGPDLVHRLNQAWNSCGQHLHMLCVEVVSAPVTCPRCGDKALYRIERRGFLQNKVYPLFGVFPWKCVSCRQSALLRLRSAGQAETGQAETVVLPQDDRNRPKAA